MEASISYPLCPGFPFRNHPGDSDPGVLVSLQTCFHSPARSCPDRSAPRYQTCTMDPNWLLHNTRGFSTYGCTRYMCHPFKIMDYGIWFHVPPVEENVGLYMIHAHNTCTLYIGMDRFHACFCLEFSGLKASWQWMASPALWVLSPCSSVTMV